MPRLSRQSNAKPGTDNFDSSVVEAAWAYHLQVGAGGAKGHVPVEVAAFIAGACWAQEALENRDKEDKN